MPKTKFQEFIFTFITSGCMIFIMGVYNVARTSGCYLQTRTAFFPIGMVHRASLCILHCQQNVQILRIPRGKINWPTNLHHPLHPDLHSLYNGAASYSVTCSLPPTKEMNLKSNTKWNSRDLQNNSVQYLPHLLSGISEDWFQYIYVMMNFCFQRKHLWIRFKKSFQFPLVFFIHKSQ